MIVLKFGGTSVGDAEGIRRLRSIVRSRLEEQPVVVVSAFAGATDQLLAAGELAAAGRLEESFAKVEQLRQRTFAIAEELLNPHHLESGAEESERLFLELENALRTVAEAREFSPKMRDAVASYGELVSSKLITATLVSAGVPAVFVDARDCVVTNDRFTRAVPLFEETDAGIRAKIGARVEQHRVPVVAGFVGSTPGGETTTLSRGGSDFSAAIIGAALKAARIEIWTDTDGILTFDPRICPDACTIEEISFEHAGLMASFGAKVIHPATVIPAIRANIPVHVLNSFNPDAEGTRIVQECGYGRTGLRGMAVKQNVAVFTISANRSVEKRRFAQSVLDIFDAYDCTVEFSSSSESTVSVVASGSDVESLRSQLLALGKVEIRSGGAIVGFVGQDLLSSASDVAAIFSVLDSTPIWMLSHGASQSSLAIVVDETDVQALARRLHARLFGGLAEVGRVPAPVVAAGVLHAGGTNDRELSSHGDNRAIRENRRIL